MKSLAVLLGLVVMMTADESVNAENKIFSKLKGRHRTDLPSDGYDDSLNVPGQKWRVHDPERPEPWVVTPGAKVGDAPSDATILFGGKDLSAWQKPNGEDAEWKVKNGYMEVTSTGSIRTREAFGSCQLEGNTRMLRLRSIFHSLY